MDFLKGKKTFILALIVGVCAAAEAMGYTIPPYVYAFLGSMGLYTVRKAIG